MSEVDGVKAINKVTFGQRLKAYKRSKLSFLLAVLVLLSAIITIGVLGYLIFYILIKGVPNLSPDLFSLTYTSENVPALAPESPPETGASKACLLAALASS